MEEQIIYMVTHISNDNGNKQEFFYPCATLEIAKAYFDQCKSRVLNDERFSGIKENPNNYEVSEYNTLFFIKNKKENAWEDIQLTSQPIINKLP